MSQQGPILLVSNAGRPAFADALDAAGLFPLIETDWTEALRAVADIQPVAVLAAMSGATAADLAALAKRVAARTQYVPLFAIDLKGRVVANAIPFLQGDTRPERLLARLRASLALTLWLASRYRIPLANVIGHNESLTSPLHRELYAPWRCQTHADWKRADMDVYRSRLRALARTEGVPLGRPPAARAGTC